MNLCIIPARGGSQRIPRKNIRKFCGKPMIAWSIEAAQASDCFDQIIVSTDDTEIAEVAQDWGAAVPFKRPLELAGDYGGTTPVIAHAVQWYKDAGQEMNAVCCLYATAPFVQPSDIKTGLDLLRRTASDRFVFTVTEYASPIQRALRIDPASGKTQMWQTDYFSERSQDLEPAFHDAAQFYWGNAQAWLHVNNLFEGSKALILPRWRVQDIDTEEDWINAELMLKALSERKIRPNK